MDSLIYSLNATVPIFLIMIIGQFIMRKGLVNENFVNCANKYVFKVALPCKLAIDLGAIDMVSDFDSKFIAFCFFVTLISILTIWFFAKKFIKEQASIGAFVQASYRSSAAILGVAFIENIYGNSGMAPLMIIGAVPLYNVFAVFILTMENPELAGSGGKEKVIKALKGIATNPIIIGIVIGTIISLFQIKFPVMINKTLNYLGSTSTPIGLIAIGAGFEGRKAIKKIKPTIASTLIKLVILEAIFLPLAVVLGFRDSKLLALIIMLGSPSTPTCYIMAKNMGSDEVLSSSIIVLTTLLSAITMTGWIFLARSMGWIL